MKPKQLASVQKMMEKYVCTVNFDKDIYRPSIAYINTIQTEKQGKIMLMYVNSRDEELAAFLYMHECGHIIFGHTESEEERMSAYLLEKIEASYKKVSYYFQKIKKTYAEFLAMFRNSLLNMAMDFEVNSRLFSQDEWDYFQKKVLEFTKDPASTGMWPLDYGYPPGLTWNEYITLMLMKPVTFMKNLQQQIAQAQAARNKIKKDGWDKYDGTLTPEEYRKIRANCAGRCFNRDEFGQFEDISKTNGNGEFAIPTGGMHGMSRGKSIPSKIDFIGYSSMEELVNAIKKLLFTKKKTGCIRNQMYNANRHKYNSAVIIPKDQRFERQERPDLYLVIDVSGSVDSEMVHDFVCSFRTVKDDFKRTVLVYWTTCLVHECLIADPEPHLYGGGTDIAQGISYVKQKYEPVPRDALFVISDFEDRMDEWETELGKIKCRKFAIDWSCNGEQKNPGFEKVLRKM